MTKNELIKSLIDIDGNHEVVIGYEYDAIYMIEESIENINIDDTILAPSRIILGSKSYSSNHE